MVTLDQVQWPRVMFTKGNAPGSNTQKTPSKNIKRFSQYTLQSEYTYSNDFHEIAEIPLVLMQIW